MKTVASAPNPSKLAGAIALAAATLLSVGCADPGPAGHWQSREKLSNSRRNELVLADDFDVDLGMFARLYQGGELVPLEYDGTWETDGNGDHDVTLICKDCAGYDGLEFELECKLDVETEHLDCAASLPFTTYGFFEFERTPE